MRRAGSVPFLPQSIPASEQTASPRPRSCAGRAPAPACAILLHVAILPASALWRDVCFLRLASQLRHMLPAERSLELRAHLPTPKAMRRDRPPLLFVHGGFCDSWCWEPHFLPWFAAHGYPSYALSLRGHGASGGHDSLWVAGLDDYAADVERVASELAASPVLIGHSMGAAVVERLLATRPLRGAALLAPVPPNGLLVVAACLAAQQPDHLMRMSQLDPGRLTSEVLHTLRPYYFSADVPAEILAEAERHLGQESPRALMDLSLRLHWQLPERPDVPVCVLGAEGDRICTPDDVLATARHHDVEPVMVEGLAHMLMLERDWERAATALLGWVDKLA